MILSNLSIDRGDTDIHQLGSFHLVSSSLGKDLPNMIFLHRIPIKNGQNRNSLCSFINIQHKLINSHKN
jgi:hypothetical protein